MIPEFKDSIRKAVESFNGIERNEQIRVITSCDVDGMCAGAIAAKALSKIGRNFHLSSLSQLDKQSVRSILQERYNVFFFCNLGSEILSDIEESVDGKKVFLLDHHFTEQTSDKVIQVNPCLSGSDTNEVSVAAVCYLFFSEMTKIDDLVYASTVGAIAKSQIFSGINKELHDVALNLGVLDEGNKLEGPIRDVKEFCQVLNACGKLGKCGKGIGAIIDKRSRNEALECLYDYKMQITKALDWFNENRGNGNIVETENYIIVNTKDKVLGTAVGTIANMITKSVKENVLVMMMARLENGKNKLSLRLSGENDEIDLRKLMKEMIRKLGHGEFGGDKHASGALIPGEKESEFLEIAKEVLEKRSIEEGIL